MTKVYFQSRAHEGKNTNDPRIQTRVHVLLGKPFHSHFITTQIRGLPQYVSLGRGQGLQKETQVNSGCLETVKICVVCSFLFSVFQKTQRQEAAGHSGSRHEFWCQAPDYHSNSLPGRPASALPLLQFKLDSTARGTLF